MSSAEKVKWKKGEEIRRDGGDRCRIKGCKIPLDKDWDARTKDGGTAHWQTMSCGNHECDKP